MRILSIIAALSAPLVALAASQSAEIYIQPVPSTANPMPLTSVTYDVAALTSTIQNFEAPELEEEHTHVRVGLYDRKSKSWVSGTTLASTENFAKGYVPTITLSTDRKGEVLSVGIKGVAVDAGVTRDFGPKAQLLVEEKGKEVELNQPVVLSPEGKRGTEEPEKSFLQKYVNFCQHFDYSSLITVSERSLKQSRQFY